MIRGESINMLILIGCNCARKANLEHIKETFKRPIFLVNALKLKQNFLRSYNAGRNHGFNEKQVDSASQTENL